MSNQRVKVKDAEVTDEFTACPYCMNQVNCERLGCCGESRDHFETAYELSNGEVYLASEIEFIKG